jgi:uncharacterized membrane protein YfcA
VKLFCSVAVGGVVGFCCAFMINATLLEISHNGFFTTYFGLVFGVIGGFMFWRAVKDFGDSRETDPNQTFARKEKNFIFLLASIVVLAACILCMILDTRWPENLNYLAKMPIFIVISEALCFAIVFCNFFCFASKKILKINSIDGHIEFYGELVPDRKLAECI